jgi:hypothetical protein
MPLAIQPKDAKIVIAARLRDMALFIETQRENNIEAYRDAVKAKLKLIDEYVDAFCNSYLMIDD